MTELIRAACGSDRWETEVRDPATSALEAGRGFTNTWTIDRSTEATYSVAPIPAGWAQQHGAFANLTAFGVPWTGPYRTRDAAESAGLNGLLTWLDGVSHRDDAADSRAAKRLQAAIRADIDQGTLFDAPEVDA